MPGRLITYDADSAAKGKLSLCWTLPLGPRRYLADGGRPARCCWTIGCCAACLARMQPKLCEAVHAERPPKLLDPRDLQRDAVLAVGAHMPSFLGGLPLLEHEHSWRAMDSGRPGRTTSQPSFTPMPWLMAVHVAVAVIRGVQGWVLPAGPASFA
ncbi:hypothetical protein FPQ18DRAFT_303985 [Pyronema domesticum]|nr:hypothetical protein FPQ18DRAFT_303985 [Pyronema domesticum]